MKNKIYFISMILLALGALMIAISAGNSFSSAAERSSSNFVIESDAISGGGTSGESSATKKIEEATAGQSAQSASQESASYKIYGGYLESNNSTPEVPTDLMQYRSDGTTVIATGEMIDSKKIVIKFTMSHPDASADLYPQVELRATSDAFTGTPNYTGGKVSYSGTPVTGVATITAPADNTNYHWQARVKDDAGYTSGFVSFGGNTETAVDFGVNYIVPPFVTVEAPDGGERWEVDSRHNITWTATDAALGVEYIDLYYTTNEGNPWITIAAGETNDGVYSWKIPNNISTEAKVRVLAANNNGKTASDESNAVFEIALLTSVYISPEGNDTTGDGTYNTPYKTVQKGLNMVEAGGRIEAFNGTYREHDLLWPNKNNITLHGAGSTETIISAESLGRIFNFGSAVSATIESLTLKKGKTSGEDNDGACIYLPSGVTLELNEVVISSNEASNTADGGAIYCADLSATIKANNSSFIGNRAEFAGVAWYGTWTVSNCVFEGNYGSDASGVSYGGNWNVNNSTFKNNHSGSMHGGVMQVGTWTVNNSKFIGNWSNDSGGVGYNCNLTATNSIFSANTATHGGVGFSGTWEVVNCSFNENTCDSTLGDVGREGAWKIKNSIFWGSNTQFYGNTGTIEYSDVQGGWASLTSKECISSDPLFVSTDSASSEFLKLLATSPCIDSGTLEGAPSTDIIGIARPQGSFYDMGAYEYNGARRVWNTTKGKGYYKIESALIDASLEAGDLITADAGTFTEHDISWPNKDNLILRGAGAGLTTIDAQSLGRIFTFEAGIKATIESLTISNGKVINGNGGGLWLPAGTRLKLNNDIFYKNAVSRSSGTYTGGAVYCVDNSVTLEVDNCSFISNEARVTTGSGALGGVARNGTWIVTDCAFSYNYASDGGGVAYYGVWNVTNSILYNNITPITGGVAGVSNWTVVNSTFYGNQGPVGGAVAINGSWDIKNSIFWGTNDPFYLITGTIKYSDVQGSDWSGFTTKECKAVDPWFVNAASGDYHLLSTSECNNTGTFEGAPSTDLDGNSRPIPNDGKSYDMGAYEQVGSLFLDDVYVSWDAGSDTSGVGSQQNPFKTINFALTKVATSGVVHAAAGTYVEKNITWPNRSNIKLLGAGSTESIISAESKGRIFLVGNFAVTISIEALTLKNGSAESGGAMWLQNGGIALNLNKVIFEGNKAAQLNGYGGAIFASGGPISGVSCIFRNNKAEQGMGGAIANDGICNFTNSIFTGNSAKITGGYVGGVFEAGTCTVTNCAFINNSATYGGVKEGGTFNIYNCSFYGNKGTSGGDISSNLSINAKNSIFWGNTSPFNTTSGTIKYSDVQGGYSGTGNISLEPLIISTAESDQDFLKLKLGSPCIDTGTSEGAPSTDFAGTLRPQPTGGKYDMGAYEYNIGTPKVHNSDKARDYYTINAALNDADSGNTITLEAGTIYYEHDIQWPNTNNIKLLGAGSTESIISAEALGRVFNFAYGVRATIEAVTLRDGYSSATGGGGLYLAGSVTLELNSISFESNSAAPGINGGAVYCVNNTVKINAKNCIFNASSAHNGGTAYNGTWNVSDSTFNNSYNGGDYGGMAYGGTWVVTNCAFSKNISGYLGGVAYYGTWDATNSIFSSNESASGGGVGYFTKFTATNCTFFGNITQNPTYISDVATGEAWKIKNCIFWGSTKQFNATVKGTIEYSDVQGGWGGLTTGVGTISADPLFISTDPANADFLKLKLGSPCIDMGTSEGAPSTDFAGTLRPQPTGGKYDMGVYEYNIGTPKVHNETKGKLYFTIYAAFNDAASGDLITLESGTYLEHDIPWPSIDNLKLRGAGSNESIISGEALGRIFYFGNAVSATIEGLTIKDGKVGGSERGGGIWLASGSTLNLGNIIITSNEAYEGGAIYCSDNTVKINVENSIFKGNISGWWGGVAKGGTWAVANSTFIGNKSLENAGVAYDGTWIVTNCAFSINSAANYGGVSQGGTWEVINSTFYGNGAVNGDVAISGKWNIVNSIFWGNDTPFDILDSGNSTVKYCDVQSPDWSQFSSSIECISLDPKFVSTVYGDQNFLRLGAKSPCIDSGTSEGATSTDLDNNTRPHGFGFDMGVYEFQGPSILLVQPNGGDTLPAGSKYNVTWNISPDADEIYVRLSTNEGSSWDTLLKHDTASYSGVGTYEWTVNNLPSTECLVTVEAKHNNIWNFDASDAKFEISTPAVPFVTVEAPNTFTTLEAGMNYEIKWSATTGGGFPANDYINIYLLTGESSEWIPIAADLENNISASSGIYTWEVNNIYASEACRISVEAIDAVDQHGYDTSDEDFRIAGYLNTVYVSPEGSDTTGDGSQGNPYQTINKGFKRVAAGGTIEAFAGTYLEHNIIWPNKNNIKLHGAGSTETIISGEALGRIISFESAVSATIESLSIRYGKFTGNGGGLFLAAGVTLELDNVLIGTCESSNDGGAVYCADNTVKVNASNCDFIKNRSNNNGGFSCSGTWVVSNSSFKNNYGGMYGGVAYYGSWTATNCTFIKNTSQDGGVAYLYSLYIWKITGCTFKDNSSGSAGLAKNGIWYVERSSFIGNKSTAGHGGVAESSTWVTTNCAFSNNSAVQNGGVADSSTWKDYNSTFSNNSAAQGATAYAGTFNCKNSIFWGSDDQFNTASGTLKYCDVQAGDWGGFSQVTNCISSEPLFVSTVSTEPDFLHLAGGSPCIDTGTTESLVTPDLAGYTRPHGLGVDMGAYEFQGPSVRVDSPNTGGSFTPGEDIPITWTTSDEEGLRVSPPPITIQYSTNEGSSWNLITAEVNDTGTYTWEAPSIISNKYLISVEAVDSDDIWNCDRSNSTFEVKDVIIPVVTVEAPTTGEVLGGGTNKLISWEASDNIGVRSNSTTIELSTDNGATWMLITSEIDSSPYNWTVNSENTTEARIKVTVLDTSNNSGSGTGGKFTIDSTAPLITVEAPTTGESLGGGTNKLITWEASDNISVRSNSTTIELSTDDGATWTLITSEINSSPFNWTVNSENTTEASIKVTVLDTSGNSGYGTGGKFTIDSTAPVVTVEAPNGEETYYFGQKTNITWSATDNIGLAANPITLRYSTNEGSSWSLIASNEANDGTFKWTVPSIVSNNYLVSVEAKDLANNIGRDISDTTFEVQQLSIVHVSTTGSDETGTGTSESPFKTIQKGLNNVAEGGVVSVEAGLYTGETSPTSRNRNIVWPNRNNITLHGAGSNETIISGEALGRIITFEAGVTATIEGLTIRSAKVINGLGGALYLVGGVTLNLNNVSISSNEVTGGDPNGFGGAIYCVNESNIVVNAQNCAFNWNKAGYDGGFASKGLWNISNSSFIGNYAAGSGGVAYIGIWTIYNSTFKNNVAGTSYGGVSVGGTLEATNCIFSNNSAGDIGGVKRYGKLTATNCIFYNNSAGRGGVGWGETTHDWVFKNCTFYKNSGEGSVFILVYTLKIYNSILWGGSDPLNSCSGILEYSNVQDSDWGGLQTKECIAKNPLFVSTSESNVNFLHLGGSSPCIDSGTTEGLVTPDLAGNLRPHGLGNDMGVYEFQGPSVRVDSPNGGGTYYPDQNINITWTTSDEGGLAANPITIRYSTNEGSSWNLITSEIDDTGIFTWEAPSIASNKYFVSVEAINASDIWNCDRSDSTFEVQYRSTVYVSWEGGSDEAGDGSYSNPYKTVQKGLNMVAAGGTVSAESGTYLEHNIIWPNTNNIRLHGAGSNESIVSAESLGRCISFESAVAATIESLTIKNGKVTGVNNGGGLYLVSGVNLTLKNTIITSNECDMTSGHGGAIYAAGANLTLVDCKFNGNKAVTGGVAQGGLWKIDNSSFNGNQADNGALFHSSTAIINNSVFTQNIGNYQGGVAVDSTVYVNNSKFINNQAGYGGIAYDGTWTVTNCAFSGNIGTSGASISRNGAWIVFNSTFYGIYEVAQNNTWTIKNSIFWGNSYPFNNVSGTIRYSDVQNGAWDNLSDRTGCITLEPKFITTDANSSDFMHLGSSSPCIDKGTTEVLITPDLAGKTRPHGFGVDMGAYEFQGPSVRVDSPNGNESYSPGEDISITWTTSDEGGLRSSPSPITIRYSTNEGSSWSLITSEIEDSGIYTWEAPSTLSQKYLVSVEAFNLGGLWNCDTSNSTFEVWDSTPPLVTVEAPNGGETFYFGQKTDITWSATDDVGLAANPITIRYSTNEGSSWNLIVSNEANDGTYRWTIPSIASSQYLVSVEAKDTVNNIGRDISDSTFEVQQLSIVYVSPSGSDETGTGTSEAPFKTIQKGLNVVAAGGIVSADAGTYLEHNIIWPNTNNITLHGAGSNETTISAEALGRAFTVHYLLNLTVEGLAITNGIEPGDTGGAFDLSVDGSHLWLKSVVIKYCSEVNFGGAICCWTNAITVSATDCTFDNNSSGTGGGVIYKGTFIANNCSFTNNMAYSSGGAVGRYTIGTAINCVFYNNNADPANGSVMSSGTWVIDNCIFINNPAVAVTAIVTARNCTFYNNDHSDGGVAYGGTWNIKNSIFWGSSDQFNGTAGTIEYSDVSSGWGSLSSIECISKDPQFVSTTYGNANFLKLKPGSPCIDSGTTEALVTPDLAGNTRPHGSGVDMGAYEFQGPSIRVDSPNGGEKYYTGQNINITWTASDEGGLRVSPKPITIRYSTNEGSSYALITSEVANTGIYTWEAPSISSVNYLISIEVVSSSELWNYDTSDSSFEVQQLSTVYVAATGSDTTGTGTSGSPFATIQKGLNAVAAGGLVSVEAGLYTGESTSSSRNRNVAWPNKNNITLRGAGSNETIISGEASGRVINFANSVAATMEGLTIRNGKISGPGAGIYLNTGNITLELISVNMLSNEATSSNGGAVWCFDNTTVKVKATNCTFRGNKGSTGGVICQGTWTVASCNFIGNISTGSGIIYDGNWTVSNTTFSSNTADAAGIANSGTWNVSNSTFSDNTSRVLGAIANSSTWYVSNSIFSGNKIIQAGSQGGVANGCIWTVTNCAFSRNSAGSGGGGVAKDSTWNVYNSTFIGNTATSGGNTANGGTWTVNNSIFWGSANQFNSMAGGTIKYSDVQGGSWDGLTPTNCISKEPLFVSTDEASPDFLKLAGGSPCIDTASIEAPSPDLAGKTRPHGFGVDMGVYEFQGPSVRVITPNGSESYSPGEDIPITWTTSDEEGLRVSPPPITIKYSTNEGSSWNSVTSEIDDTGIFTWEAPSIVSNKYLISVEAVDLSDYWNCDRSDSTFEVKDVTSPLVTVEAPNGGESYYFRQQVNITWSATDDIGLAANPITIRYSTNEGSGWSLIASNEANDGTYKWTVPLIASSKYLVSVEAKDLANNIGRDISDATFEVQQLSIVYVSTIGSDETGTGTVEAPFKTIQKGLDNVAAGGLVSVEAGLYTGEASATSRNRKIVWPNTNNITLRGAGQGLTTLDAQGAGRCISFESAVTATIEDFTIQGGKIAAVGGGIYLRASGAKLFLEDVTGKLCSSELAGSARGGFLYIAAGTEARTNRCKIKNNHVLVGTYGGGGVSNYGTYYSTNDIFIGNRAYCGGAILHEGGTSVIVNTDLMYNSVTGSGADGGAIFKFGSGGASCRNCLLWGNTPNQVGNFTGYTVIQYSDVQGGYSGTGNITAEPSFISTSESNANFLKLAPGSPCIDTASKEAPTPDLAGFARPHGLGNDMGVYEFQGPSVRVIWPNGGEYVTVEASNKIIFNVSPEVTEIYINLSTNEGATWDTLITHEGNGSSTIYSGVSTYEWTPPLSLASSECRISIEVMADILWNTDKSDAKFSIAKYTPPSSEIWVATTGSDLTGGGTEGDPYRTIAFGLTKIVTTGGTVHVATGEYREKNISWPNISIIKLLGAGSNETIISGESTNRVFNFGSAVTATIEGLTIRNGKITGNGAGIYMNIASTTLELNSVNMISNEAASNGGGAIYCLNNTVKVKAANCTFTGNSANNGGAGYQGTWTVSNCAFNGNKATTYGGAAYYGTWTVTNCAFSGNKATTSGGVVYNVAGTVWNVNNSTFNSNTAATGGVAYAAYDWLFTNCIFKNNSASNNGGVAYFTKWTVSNCAFSTNSATNYGGVIYADTTGAGYAWNINNTTFYGNNAATGDAVYLSGSWVVRNSIFGGSNDQFNGTLGTIRYSDVQGGSYGGLTVQTGCITNEPQLASTVESDPNYLRLGPGSPCIDTGTTESLVTPDLSGNVRPHGLGVDMGAYEFQGPSVKVLSPNGGNLYYAGQNVNITWTATDEGGLRASPLPITIRYSTNEGTSWNLITSEIAHTGIYTWETQKISSDKYLISVEAVNAQGLWNCDRSDSTFEVKVLSLVYVSWESGNDTTGYGTYSNPFKTIQKGLNMVMSGGSVEAAAGTYLEHDIVWPNTNNIKLYGLGPGLTTIDAQAQGRVISVESSVTATIEDMTIQNGKVISKDGGGILLSKGNLFLDNVYGLYCTAEWIGAANGGFLFVSTGTNARTSNCVFKYNFATQGGVIFVYQGGSSYYGNNNIFESNYSRGAIFNHNIGSSIQLYNNIFRNNRATGTPIYADRGAALTLGSNSTCTAKNNIFIGNKANVKTGGVEVYGTYYDYNNTYVSNEVTSAGGGGAIYIDLGGTYFVRNSVYYNNKATSGADHIYKNNGSADIKYSCIPGGTGLYNITLTFDSVDHNIKNDPSFASIDKDSSSYLRLAGGSACIDSGTTEGTYSPDLAGYSRKHGLGTDMGAYEFQGPSVKVLTPNGGVSYESGDDITITWTTSDEGGLATDPITIRYSSNNGSSWNLITAEIADSGIYTWEAPGTGSKQYLISIEAINAVALWNCDTSDSTFEVTGPLYPPTNLVADALPPESPTYVRLSWTASSTESIDGYKVYRGSTYEVYEITDIGSTTETVYDDTTVISGNNYFYAVKAYRAANLSDYSNDASAPLMKMTRTSTVEAPVAGGYTGGEHDAVPGATIKYSLEYENLGFAPAANIIINDKVPNNTDYKIGSATGEAALSITFSNNNGSTFIYTPTGTNIDPNVTNISWEVENVYPTIIKLCTFEVVIE